MAENLAKILESCIINNIFCNIISHQMTCVNVEFYNINIKINKHAYLKRTKDIQNIIYKLSFIENLNMNKDYIIVSNNFLIELGNNLDKLIHSDIMKDISLTFYCLNVYANKYNNDNIIMHYNFPNDNIKILYWKKDEIPINFIFEFTFNLWKKINSTLVFSYPDTYNNFTLSLSSVFKKEFHNYLNKHNIALIFTDTRYTNYMISKTEYKEGKKFITNLLKYINKDLLPQDYTTLTTIKPTMTKLINSHSNLKEHEYFKFFMFEDITLYFIHQLIFDIIQNSLFTTTNNIEDWISGYFSGLLE